MKWHTPRLGIPVLHQNVAFVFSPWPWFGVTNTGSHASTFGIAKHVLIDGSKGIFKFGILGTMERGLLSLLEFLSFRAGAGLHPGSGQCWCYHKNVSLDSAPWCHLLLSWMVRLVPASGHWEALASEMIDTSTNTKVFNFPSILRSKGEMGSPHFPWSSLPPPSPLASFHTSCDAWSVYVITAVYHRWCMCILGCLVFLVIFQCVRLDMLLEDRTHAFFILKEFFLL